MDGKHQSSPKVIFKGKLQLFDSNVAHSRCDSTIHEFSIVFEQDQQSNLNWNRKHQ